MKAYMSHARNAGWLAATVLVLALVTAAPSVGADCGTSAHPSGKDRCTEEGGSGTQGSATSDPDDDGRGPDRTNGGVDQEGGDGGVNQQDQDGNNGCGNDQDFEDDNEGLCGGATPATRDRTAKPKGEKAAGGGAAKPPAETSGGSPTVTPGGSPTRGHTPRGNGGGAAEEAEVLGGVSDARRPTAALSSGSGDATAVGPLAAVGRAASALAATGVGSLALLLAALALLGLGMIALRRGRASR